MRLARKTMSSNSYTPTGDLLSHSQVHVESEWKVDGAMDVLKALLTNPDASRLAKSHKNAYADMLLCCCVIHD